MNIMQLQTQGNICHLFIHQCALSLTARGSGLGVAVKIEAMLTGF